MKQQWLPLATFLALASTTVSAGENLFGTLKGAETLPEGASELYQKVIYRSDKGQGVYRATDYITEYEYGATNKLSVTSGIKLMTLETSGLIIDGYLPSVKSFDFKPKGIEASLKYMFLSPALDDIGLAGSLSFDYDWIDTHSGQDKDTFSIETDLLLQQFALEGELVWATNIGTEFTFADRAEIANLPQDFEWPTDPEMEIEIKIGTGLSYRFMPNWFVSFEGFYETEFETEVGQERWSFFAGPSLHFGDKDWW